MAGQIAAYTFWAGVISLIAGGIVLSWPYRRERRFTFRRLIAAPRERIWDICDPAAGDPNFEVVHSNLVSKRKVSDAPEIWEYVVDGSKGHGTHLVTTLIENLAESRPAHSVSRIREANGKPYPFGEGNRESLNLAEQPGGTLATVGWCGECATLWHYLYIWFYYRRHLRRIQRFCESGIVTPEVSKGRAFWTSLALSGIAVGSFALIFGWIVAFILAVILVVHEFGHWLAMRLTGQPAPRVLLIPFFGGVAVANHPHKTLFDDAFCALMGPGFSALLALVLLLATWGLGAPDMSEFWAESRPSRLSDLGDRFVAMTLVGIAVMFNIILGWLNVVQLLPVLPLDGGQVLRTLIQSISAKWARRILLAVSGLGVAGLGYVGYYISAGILGLGALQAWHMGTDAPKARPMSAAGATVIVFGYGVIFAIHAAAVLFGLRLLGIGN